MRDVQEETATQPRLAGRDRMTSNVSGKSNGHRPPRGERGARAIPHAIAGLKPWRTSRFVGIDCYGRGPGDWLARHGSCRWQNWRENTTNEGGGYV